jgi:quinol monooxygenase YgiN
MKRLPVFVAICMVVFLFSCGSGPAKDDTKTADTTAAVVADTTAVVKPAFVPFKVLMIQHKVKNFGKWEEAYLAHDSVRKAYGISSWIVGRDLKDSNMIFILDKMEDLAKAQSFSTLPNLKDVMKKAGVISAPGFSYAEIIRNNDSAVESSDRISVAHHVKDFSTWLKAFDAEGPATRTANGMVDRLLGRSLVDSNMIYIVFAITDMAKAKARLASPELKKIMTDAGVDSPPTVRWYRVTK